MIAECCINRSPQQTRNLRPPLPTPSDDFSSTEVELHRSSVRRFSRQTHLQEAECPRRQEIGVCSGELSFGAPEIEQQVCAPLQSAATSLSPLPSHFNNLSEYTGLLSPPLTQQSTTTESHTTSTSDLNICFVNLTPETSGSETPSITAPSTSTLTSHNQSNRLRAQQERRRREQMRRMEQIQERQIVRFADNGVVTNSLNTPQMDKTDGAGNDIEREESDLDYCGAKHWLAEKLVRSPQTSPIFVACCDHGTVNIPRLQSPPDILRHLFIGDNDQSKNFHDNISEYNQALAFTSIGVAQESYGSLLPPQGRAPVYAQLYFYDPRSAVDLRMSNNQHRQLRQDTMETLQQVIYDNHQYAPLYLHAHEILRRYDSENVSIRLRVSPGTVRGPATNAQSANSTHIHDPRLYRPPTADEVALIYPEDPSAEWRDIVLRRRSGRLERISECHPAYKPLQYVLLFPYGETGWFPKLEIQNTRNRSKRTKVTLLRYTAFRLHDRSDEFSCLLRGGRLLQRYIVDMWAAADQKNLRYLRQNQHLFRCPISSGLMDAFNDADGDIDLNELGQRVILPSSYTGGPRQMHERFQDSLAIARHLKKVDLFITMTCNPRWKEIQDELKEHETPYDRPDLVSRMFQLKKEALLEDILKHGVLGRVVAYVYTIEFQKRGLPHMHLLIFFDAAHKLFTPEEIDKLIWARWPDKDQHPLLFETVKSCMVHGPCGAANPNAICMDPEKKICSKRFPKDFCEATNMDGSGYPEYYRPNDGVSVQVRNGFHADNRWIVPYCPYLSAKYDCHLNVECAISLNSLKYVFKYIQKGLDRTIMELHRRDEIKRWLDARYVSASKASWRSFGFDLHRLNPTVTQLAIHLPGHYMVSFNPNENPEEIRRHARFFKSYLRKSG
ncbi:hypothetical protein CVT24_010778 [Panaeolus cyanescens]|uniref:Helitron helicase-like domain-containing protein n=1 Tax=Panaeolus cyanescens TaxID=181874 RepID=A0A409YVZ1_9AGAR|nr:hypothetical protein CVT24_010778 [Panaeolus cyanescens]